MCGIIGILGKSSASPRIMEALRRLEYRGYDSAGIATISGETLDRRRAVGKLDALEAELVRSPIKGHTGIGHTRWATHGEPTIENAHPHMTSRVALVHNGIIENFQTLKNELLEEGVHFDGATDTEVVTRLMTNLMEGGLSAPDAFKATLDRLEGAFALCVLVSGDEDLMLGARRGSPLVAGIGSGENFLGSDALALAGITNQLIYLNEGDWVIMTRDSLDVYDSNGKPVKREISMSHITSSLVNKGNHRHFMQKEIFEQPTVVAETLGRYLDPIKSMVNLPDLPFDLESISKITLVACGTSYYAASVARYWIEKYARVPVDVDIASEFRYRDPIYADDGLCIFISQSGETADTLAALKHANQAGQNTAAIINVQESTMAREADTVLPTYAGTEIGVASTKAFTCQLSVLAAFAVALGRAKSTLSQEEEISLVRELKHLPVAMAKVLKEESALKAIAREIADARDIIFVGRGIHFPIAMEGALKLKEISYIHAEGYAAGELKHGPIALIDETVPVIGIAPSDGLLDKSISNLQEIMARKGRVVLFSDHLDSLPKDDLAGSYAMPSAGDITSPILYALPVQLLAYYTALEKGTDVDQPRNLAKSVTVE